MKNRRKRVETMIDIINKHVVGSQEELAMMLHKKGFDVTQATLSRDLKMLKTTKVPTDRGSYMYVMPGSSTFKNKMATKAVKTGKAMTESQVESVTFSGHMVVLKTTPGYAQAVASLIDKLKIKEILGTVAGFDTVFVVMADNMPRLQTIQIFSDLFEIDKE